jgi:release factor glutamine methyltransferase
VNPGGCTVAQALREAKALGVDRLDGQLLLAHVVGQTRSWLVAHDDAALSIGQHEALQVLLHRRVAGEPVAYLVGEKAFHGLTLQVGPDVLVPRPDTEVLVDWALELLRTQWPDVAKPRVIDLGTGSGAIALAVKHAHPSATVLATDLSPRAIDVAAANATRLGLDIELKQAQWWNGLHGRSFELVLSNPPYIAGDDPHLAALRYEPTLALTPGGDGLGALREIAAEAQAHAEPGTWLLLEHGYDQAEAVRTLLRNHGFRQIETRRDLGGQERCTGGAW